MEIRGIFIFNNEALVYRQVYPLIEKQVKTQFGSNYYEPLPEPNHLQDYIKKKRDLNKETYITFKEPVEIVNLEEYKPSETDQNNIKQIFHKEEETIDKYFDEKHYLFKDLYLTIGSKKWLTLTFQRNEWTLFIFPREEIAPNSKEFTYNSVINNVSIYAAVQFGKKFIEFLDENMSKRGNIEDSIDFILLNCIPFGRILTDHFMPFLICLTDGKTTLAAPNTQENKLPSHQDKFIIQDPIKKAVFSLEERIISYQFNKDNVSDFIQIEGRIKCKVDSISDEEISVTILNLNEEKIALTTYGVIEKSLMPNQIGTKITFSIPDQKEFDICHYTFDSIPATSVLPITGSYCRKQLSETQIGLGVELDIHEKWRPFIKDLKFQMRLDPFKTIAVNNLIASDGKIEINQSKLITWSLPRPQDIKGQITIKGSISIESQNQATEEKVLMKDFIKELHETSHINQHKLEENDLLFCLPDRYVEVGFEIADSLLSDVGLSPGQVVIFPTRKLNIKIQKQTKTWRYFIFLEDDNEFRPVENNLY